MASSLSATGRITSIIRREADSECSTLFKQVDLHIQRVKNLTNAFTEYWVARILSYCSLSE